MRKSASFTKRIIPVLILLWAFAAAGSAQAAIGDVNGDSSIDIIDALLVAQYNVGIRPLQFDTNAADVDGNGAVSIVDALMIAQYYVGLITRFPRATPTATQAPTPTPPAFDYKQVIRDWAAGSGIDLTAYVFKLIQSGAVSYMFPDYTFCLLYVQQFPVGYCCPDELLGMQCIMAIDKNLRVAAIPEESDLQVFYKSNQVPAAGTTGLRQAIKAWLALSQEDKNDGFYTFIIPDENITITPWDGGAPYSYFVTGESHVLTGGEGVIIASAYFDTGDLLYSVTEEVAMIPGARPVCQSTKLLDPDPLVRKMAEQALLTMGVSAKDYLFTQRAKSAPALRAAIDRTWKRILEQEEQRKSIYQLLTK